MAGWEGSEIASFSAVYPADTPKEFRGAAEDMKILTAGPTPGTLRDFLMAVPDMKILPAGSTAGTLKEFIGALGETKILATGPTTTVVLDADNHF
jgi:hypothetical protein